MGVFLTDYTFLLYLIILFVPVDDKQKRVGYRTMASYSDEGSSFEQVIAIKAARYTVVMIWVTHSKLINVSS